MPMKRLIALAAIMLLVTGCAMLPGPEIRGVRAFAGHKPYEIELVCYSEAVSFTWKIEGVTLHGQRITHQLSGPGEYVAEVTVRDGSGGISRGSAQFEVSYSSVCFWEAEDVWACTYTQGGL